MFKKILEFKELKQENKQCKKTIKDMEELLFVVKRDSKISLDKINLILDKTNSQISDLSMGYTELLIKNSDLTKENKELRLGQESLKVKKSPKKVSGKDVKETV